MKKCIYAVIAFMVMTAGVSAQKKITHKELEGHWELEVFDVGGILVDVKKKAINFNDEVSGAFTEEKKTEIRESFAGTLEAFQGGYVDFKKNNEITVFLETPDNGTYSLEEEEGMQYLAINYAEDDSVDEFLVEFDGKQLRLVTEDDGVEIAFVYKKK